MAEILFFVPLFSQGLAGGQSFAGMKIHHITALN